MFPQTEIDNFRKYWKRRRPGRSTAVHYSSDATIFFKWAQGQSPESVTVRGCGPIRGVATRSGSRPRNHHASGARRAEVLRLLGLCPRPGLAESGHPASTLCGARLSAPRDVTEEVDRASFQRDREPSARSGSLYPDATCWFAGRRSGPSLRLTEIELARDHHPHLPVCRAKANGSASSISLPQPYTCRNTWRLDWPIQASGCF